MSEVSIDKGQVVSCKDALTRDWYAWNNLMPPKPDDFHVVGEVQVGNPGITVTLRPKEHQGINPDILLMDLILVQLPGVWPRVITWAPARYDKVLLNSTYRSVEIYCDGNRIAEVPVEDVH